MENKQRKYIQKRLYKDKKFYRILFETFWFKISFIKPSAFSRKNGTKGKMIRPKSQLIMLSFLTH